MSQQVKIEKVIDGKTYEITGTVDFKDMNIKLIDSTPVDPVDPEPGVEKPKEGTIKEGGWGANQDAKTWSVTNMRNPSDQFKVIDDKKINVATNFKTKVSAENFINYFKSNPLPPKPTPEPEPKPEPQPNPNPTPSPSGGSVTSDGVQLPYPTTGKESKTYRNNDRDDGKRMDFVTLSDWSPDTGVLGYFAFPNGKVPDDEVSGKWSVEGHSDGTDPKCYDLGVKNKGGATRWRFESPHPNYTSDLGKGENGVSLGTKYVGYLFTRQNLADGKSVRLEIWQDSGDSEGTKPANKWKKLASWVDSKYNIRKYPKGPLVTIRVDGSNVVKDMGIKWVTCVEFKSLT